MTKAELIAKIEELEKENVPLTTGVVIMGYPDGHADRCRELLFYHVRAALIDAPATYRMIQAFTQQPPAPRETCRWVSIRLQGRRTECGSIINNNRLTGPFETMQFCPNCGKRIELAEEAGEQ